MPNAYENHPCRVHCKPADRPPVKHGSVLILSVRESSVLVAAALCLSVCFDAAGRFICTAVQKLKPMHKNSISCIKPATDARFFINFESEGSDIILQVEVGTKILCMTLSILFLKLRYGQNHCRPT